LKSAPALASPTGDGLKSDAAYPIVDAPLSSLTLILGCYPALEFRRERRLVAVDVWEQACVPYPMLVGAQPALECGSLLPLWRQPACWLGIVLPIEIPASTLAGRKAAASCRTPKLRIGARPSKPVVRNPDWGTRGPSRSWNPGCRWGATGRSSRGLGLGVEGSGLGGRCRAEPRSASGRASPALVTGHSSLVTALSSSRMRVLVSGRM
jgi:hypothetical protein